MKEPKRYYCGNGEGMFEDDNGHWVEYSKHKAIVEALTEQLRKHDVVERSERLPPKYTPCGGCGADNPNDRCINCFHDFGGN